MSTTWENNLDLDGVLAKVQNDLDALGDGAQVILNRSDELVPKESGDLAASGRVNKDRGGLNTVGITYDGPYARYQHENITFKHPQGGAAKFLELAMLEKGEAAVNKTGETIWDHITSQGWGTM